MSRNKYPEETVEKILVVAEELFFEKGYDNTTIQDIVDRLGGLTKGAIYHHYKSKEEILLGVADRIFSKEGSAGIETVSDSADAKSKFGAFFSEIIVDKRENRIREIYPDLKKTPVLLVQVLINSMKGTAVDKLNDIIDEGVQSNIITTKYPKELAQTLMILLNFWLSPYVWPDEIDLQRKIGFVNELLEKFDIGNLQELLSEESYKKIFNLPKRN